MVRIEALISIKHILAMHNRRFPAPWSAEVQPNYYVVRDADGQQLAYIYYECEPGRRSAAKLLTKDETRRFLRHRDEGAVSVFDFCWAWCAILRQRRAKSRYTPRSTSSATN